MNNLGFCFEKGIGCQSDLVKALYWYEEAGKKGDMYGMRNAGIFYKEGIGVNKDLEKARELIKNSFSKN